MMSLNFLFQLLENIVSFPNLTNKSKAAVHAIHAAILIEYDESVSSYEKACDFAKKACDLDPITCDWYNIYSLVLISQQEYLTNEFQMALVKLSLFKIDTVRLYYITRFKILGY